MLLASTFPELFIDLPPVTGEELTKGGCLDEDDLAPLTPLGFWVLSRRSNHHKAGILKAVERSLKLWGRDGDGPSRLAVPNGSFRRDEMQKEPSGVLLRQRVQKRRWDVLVPHGYILLLCPDKLCGSCPTARCGSGMNPPFPLRRGRPRTSLTSWNHRHSTWFARRLTT